MLSGIISRVACFSLPFYLDYRIHIAAVCHLYWSLPLTIQYIFEIDKGPDNTKTAAPKGNFFLQILLACKYVNWIVSNFAGVVLIFWSLFQAIIGESSILQGIFRKPYLLQIFFWQLVPNLSCSHFLYFLLSQAFLSRERRRRNGCRRDYLVLVPPCNNTDPLSFSWWVWEAFFPHPFSLPKT